MGGERGWERGEGLGALMGAATAISTPDSGCLPIPLTPPPPPSPAGRQEEEWDRKVVLKTVDSDDPSVHAASLAAAAEVRRALR